MKDRSQVTGLKIVLSMFKILQENFICLAVTLLAASASLQAAKPILIDNFVNKIPDSDGIKNFWATETDAGFTISEKDNMINFDLSGGGGAKYAAIRSTKNPGDYNFFNKRKVMYVKKMRKSGSAAGKFRFEVTATQQKYSDASDAVWVEVSGKNADLFIKKNGNVSVTRSITLEADCCMFILELDNNKYYLKSYAQVKRPNDPKRKNQIRVQTMSGTHGLNQGQWGTNGGSYLGISANRTAASGNFHYDLAELRVVNHSDITNAGSYYDVFAKGTPPGVSANDPFYKKGLLNVRNAPYNAAGNGIADDTAAIQNAVVDAYEYDLITYIPSGTYLIKDKIMGVQKAIIRKPGNWDNNGHDVTGTQNVMNGKSYQTYTVYGDQTNPPVLKLADNSPGFGATSNNFTPGLQREIFQIWSQPNGIQVNVRDALSEDPIESSTGLLYNVIVRDLKIDMGRNRGAIGFNVAGSQGCTVSNISVTAPPGFGFACFRDLGGVGGGNVMLSGVGAKYGVYTNRIESSYPHIAGLYLADQTIESIYHTFHNPLTVVGAKIIKDNAPIMTLQIGHTSGSHVSFIDTVIEFRNNNAGKAIVNTNNRILHMHNVYIRKASKVTKNHLANQTGWTLVKEYAFNDKNAQGLIGGNRTTTVKDVYVDITKNASAPTEDYILKHCPPPATFPGIKQIVGSNGNNGSAVSIKDSRIAGDNNAGDWHAEIQEAINRWETVFIPMGSFNISKPLVLKANTKLIGLGPVWSVIGTHSSWNQPLNTAMIKAPNNTNPIMSNFKIQALPAKGNAAVLWQGGKKSITRSIKVATPPSPKHAKAVQVWKFTGQGGGRHFGNLITAGGYKPQANYRIIQALGTSNPLAIYGINSETGKTPHHEIKNSSNVYIFHIKNEVGGLVLQVDNSSNVLVAGEGGKIIPKGTNNGIVNVLNNCNNISVANICPLKKSGSGYTAKLGNTRIEYPKLVSLMKKGATPTILGFGPPPSNGGGNNAPVLANIGNKNVNENQSLTVNFSSSDADGDPITLSATGIPGFGTLVDNGDGSGSITFTPSYAAAGPYPITVTADDGQDTHSRSFTLTVNNVNRKPNLSVIADQSVNAGSSLVVNITSSDQDGDAITLSTPGLPAFGSLTDNGDGTGSIAFNPSNADSGSYTIRYRATDTHNEFREKTFLLTVNGVNTAPTVAAISNKTGNENTTITVGISATDPEGDPITLSATGIPGFGSLYDNGDGTGSIVFNPGYNKSGTYPIVVSAEDPAGLSDTEPFNLIVNNVNRAPSIAGIADHNMSEGSSLQIGVSASDPDSNDSLTLSVNNLPPFGSFVDNGDGTGTLDFNPNIGDECIHIVVVTVNDGNANNNTAQVVFTLAVETAVAFRTDFSSGVATDNFTGDTGNFTIADGMIDTNTPGIWSKINVKSTLFPSTTENYRIVARMKSVSVGNAYEGAALRFRDINSSNFYELELRAAAGIDTVLHGKVNGVAETVAQWDLDLDPNAWNTFSLDVTANHVNLYVGNTLIGGGAIGLSTGKVGLRQRANEASWDYYRVIGTGESDYAEDFNDQVVQDWVFGASDFQTVDTGGGDFALAQAAGKNWKFATFNQTVSVDSNYLVRVDGRATGARTNIFDSPILVLKYVNNQNWVYLYLKQGTSSGSASAIVLKKKIGNVATEYDLPGSVGDIDVNNWHNIQARVDGTSLSVWVDGGAPRTTNHTEVDLGNAVFGSTTRCGVRTTTSGALQFDNFVVVDEYDQP